MARGHGAVGREGSYCSRRGSYCSRRLPVPGRTKCRPNFYEPQEIGKGARGEGGKIRGQLLQHTPEDGTADWTLAVMVRGSIRKRLEAANARFEGRYCSTPLKMARQTGPWPSSCAAQSGKGWRLQMRRAEARTTARAMMLKNWVAAEVFTCVAGPCSSRT